MQRLPPLALVATATVLFAFKGIIARVAFGTGMTVLGVIFLRVAFATPMYVAAAWTMRHKQTAHEARPRDFVEAFGAGIFFLAAAACDFSAIERIGAGPSRVILFSFPGVVLTIEAILERRFPPARQVGIFAVAWMGLALVAAPEGLQSLQGRDLSGALFALGGSITYAVFLTVSHRSMQRLGSIRFTGIGNVGTAFALAVFLPFVATEADFEFTREGIAWMVLLASACTVVPFFMLAEGVNRAGAAKASLVTLIGPPITVTAAFFLLGERLTPPQVLGTALVLGAVSFLKRKKAAPTAEPDLPEPAKSTA